MDVQDYWRYTVQGSLHGTVKVDKLKSEEMLPLVDEMALGTLMYIYRDTRGMLIEYNHEFALSNDFKFEFEIENRDVNKALLTLKRRQNNDIPLGWVREISLTRQHKRRMKYVLGSINYNLFVWNCQTALAYVFDGVRLSWEIDLWVAWATRYLDEGLIEHLRGLLTAPVVKDSLINEALNYPAGIVPRLVSLSEHIDYTTSNTFSIVAAGEYNKIRLIEKICGQANVTRRNARGVRQAIFEVNRGNNIIRINLTFATVDLAPNLQSVVRHIDVLLYTIPKTSNANYMVNLRVIKNSFRFAVNVNRIYCVVDQVVQRRKIRSLLFPEGRIQTITFDSSSANFRKRVLTGQNGPPMEF